MNTSEAPPVELTPELQKALDESGGKPPVVVDQRTQQTYVLIRSEVYQRLTGSPTPAQPFVIPEGIRLSKAALRRDLPELLANRRTRGKYVCYHKDKRVAVERDYLSVIAEVVRLNIPEDEYIVESVEPSAGSEEEEEVESRFV
jgi:hypothetical protein